MPDITMCSGEKVSGCAILSCPMKDTCYRHTAKPNEYRQSYFMKAPFMYDEDVLFCDHYIPEEKKDD